MVEELTAKVVEHVPEARLTDTAGQDVSFVLPAEKSEHFEPLLRELERAKEKLGLASYGVTATTLEEVFLKVAAIAEEKSFRESDEDGTEIDSIDKNRQTVRLYVQFAKDLE